MKMFGNGRAEKCVPIVDLPNRGAYIKSVFISNPFALLTVAIQYRWFGFYFRYVAPILRIGRPYNRSEVACSCLLPRLRVNHPEEYRAIGFAIGHDDLVGE